MEDVHHLPSRTRCLDEHVLRMVEVVQEVPVEQRLPLLAETEPGVDLGAGLLRHHCAQEVDVAGRNVHVDHEIRAREREEHADVAGVEEDGVEDEAPAALVEDGDHERHLVVAVEELADDIGRLVAVEGRVEHLHLVVRLRRWPEPTDVLEDRAHHAVDVPGEVGERTAPAVVLEQTGERRAQATLAG